MSSIDLNKTETGRLAALMVADAEGGRPWHPEELGAILRHQLAAPLDEDLGRIVAAAGRSDRKTGPDPVSFADLLQHPDPPPELLEAAKRFAKAQRGRGDAGLPEEVAAVLYHASIVAARLRLGLRISDLGDAALREGLRWALGLPWLDEPTRALLQDGVALLDAGAGST